MSHAFPLTQDAGGLARRAFDRGQDIANAEQGWRTNEQDEVEMRNSLRFSGAASLQSFNKDTNKGMFYNGTGLRSGASSRCSPD